MGTKSLLDFAVAHEMRDAVCDSMREDKADRIAELLQRSAPLSCQGTSDGTRFLDRGSQRSSSEALGIHVSFWPMFANAGF
jgi:hypothetical protein